MDFVHARPPASIQTKWHKRARVIEVQLNVSHENRALARERIGVESVACWRWRRWGQNEQTRTRKSLTCRHVVFGPGHIAFTDDIHGAARRHGGTARVHVNGTEKTSISKIQCGMGGHDLHYSSNMKGMMLVECVFAHVGELQCVHGGGEDVFCRRQSHLNTTGLYWKSVDLHCGQTVRVVWYFMFLLFLANSLYHSFFNDEAANMHLVLILCVRLEKPDKANICRYSNCMLFTYASDAQLKPQFPLTRDVEINIYSTRSIDNSRCKLKCNYSNIEVEPFARWFKTQKSNMYTSSIM